MAESQTDRFRVVIAGGGVAALEGLLALREFGVGGIDIDMLAPEDELVYSRCRAASRA